MRVVGFSSPFSAFFNRIYLSSQLACHIFSSGRLSLVAGRRSSERLCAIDIAYRPALLSVLLLFEGQAELDRAWALFFQTAQLVNHKCITDGSIFRFLNFSNLYIYMSQLLLNYMIFFLIYSKTSRNQIIVNILLSFSF